MQLTNLLPSSTPVSLLEQKAPTTPLAQGNLSEMREAFDQFVGEAFYGQLLGAMRKTVGKPAYFDGGRAEEIFQGQLDQTLAEEMTKAGVDSFAGPMFELFTLNRS